jgi:FkbM family methyltransferase
MFFKMKEIARIWNFSPTEILHIGAHNAEELYDYMKCNPSRVVWVEAQESKYLDLKERFKFDEVNYAVQAAVWSQSGQNLELIISNNSESSSMLEFAEHKKVYPNIFEVARVVVKTVTIDDLFQNSFEPDFVNIDIQGAEMHALKGGTKLLKNCKMIYLEVNSVENYSGCALVGDVDLFLDEIGFQRVATRWWQKDGWGDAIYLKFEAKKKYSIFSKLFCAFYSLRWNSINWIRFILTYFRKKFRLS